MGHPVVVHAGDWSGLRELEGDELMSRLLSNLDALLEGSLTSAEVEDACLGELPEPLRVLWYLNWLDFEVCQGSLLAYFFNSHGRHAPLAEQALRRIGAGKSADVLAEAKRTVLGESAAWTERHQELDALPAYSVTRPYSGLPGASALSELTDRLHEALAEDDWGLGLERYLTDERASLDVWATKP